MTDHLTLIRQARALHWRLVGIENRYAEERGISDARTLRMVALVDHAQRRVWRRMLKAHGFPIP